MNQQFDDMICSSGVIATELGEPLHLSGSFAGSRMAVKGLLDVRVVFRAVLALAHAFTL